MSKKVYQALEQGNSDEAQRLIERGQITPGFLFKGKNLLHVAAEHNHAHLIDLLVQHQVPLTSCESYRMTALHYAAKEGHGEVVCALLRQEINCNAVNHQGYTPLHLAVFYGHTEVVRIFVAHPNVEVNTSNKKKETVLYSAAFKGNIHIVEALLSRSALNSSKEDGSNALHCAAQEGHAEVLHALLRQGNDCNEATHQGWTPLHFAAYRGHEPVARVLLAESKIKIDGVIKNPATPLHLAAQEGHEHIVVLFLSKGAEFHATDDRGNTPLHWAVHNNHLKVVQVLIQYGVSANLKNHKGHSAVHKAAEMGHFDVLKALIKDPKMDFLGWTLLHWASHKGRLDLVTFFLNHEKINKDAVTNQGETALWLACDAGHAPVVQILMQHNNPNLANHKGITPLFMAALRGHHSTVAVLLKHKDINCNASIEGRTPLHVATHYSRVAVVKHLLNHEGTDPNARTPEGLRPLLIAARKNCFETFSALMDHPNINPDLTGPYGELFISEVVLMHRFSDRSQSLLRRPRLPLPQAPVSESDHLLNASVGWSHALWNTSVLEHHTPGGSEVLPPRHGPIVFTMTAIPSHGSKQQRSHKRKKQPHADESLEIASSSGTEEPSRKRKAPQEPQEARETASASCNTTLNNQKTNSDFNLEQLKREKP